MVDFNRWLIGVPADIRSEGIQWEPSYGEDPWLALEEQPHSSLEEGTAASEEHTINVLKDMLEFYMAHCDRLLDTNSNLSTQVAELKAQMSEALTCVFESPLIAERQDELFELRYRRLMEGVQCTASFVDVEVSTSSSPVADST